MPDYRYEATRLDGKKVRGSVRAADTNVLRDTLRAQGLYLVSWQEDSGKKSGYRLKARVLAEFCRELGAMLTSGVPLIRAIQIMSQRDITPKVKAIYSNIYRCLQQGMVLSEAMAQQGNAFPELLISMYKASEASGRLDLTSEKMAAHYEKSYRLNRKVRNAMIYPIFLIVVTICVVAIIFLAVLPKFFQVFTNMDAPMPAITAFMLRVSNGMVANWMWILIGVLLAVLALQSLLRIPSVRLATSRWKIHLPVIGKLLRLIYTARFARSLSSLYASGISIINALGNARSTVGNPYIESQFAEMIRRVRSGGSLSEAVALVDGFDSKLAASILIGEETGRLEDMLESTANTFDYEADMAIQRLTALVEPCLIIILAIVIGSIMISVMLPILSLYDTIGAAGGM